MSLVQFTTQAVYPSSPLLNFLQFFSLTFIYGDVAGRRHVRLKVIVPTVNIHNAAIHVTIG